MTCSARGSRERMEGERRVEGEEEEEEEGPAAPEEEEEEEEIEEASMRGPYVVQKVWKSIVQPSSPARRRRPAAALLSSLMISYWCGGVRWVGGWVGGLGGSRDSGPLGREGARGGVRCF